MRKEIENWIKQGKEEFDTAEINFKNSKYFSAQYYVSRYPDATEDVPYLTYTKEEVQDYLNKAKEFIKWLDLQIKKH